MKEQRCKYCNYAWEYKGVMEYFATCPSCLRKTPIVRTAEEVELIRSWKKSQEGEDVKPTRDNN